MLTYKITPPRTFGWNGTESVSPEVLLPLQEVVSGDLARVFKYERKNQKCPADDFLRGIAKPMKKRFDGQCGSLTKMGVLHVNQQRFHPLHKDGRPLWELKEHDHRLYCARLPRPDNKLDVVLLNGWIKEKDRKTEKEDREISKAVGFYNEFLAEFPGGNIS